MASFKSEARLLRALDPADVLIVSGLEVRTIDRDLPNILDATAQAGAGFRSLKDA